MKKYLDEIIVLISLFALAWTLLCSDIFKSIYLNFKLDEFFTILFFLNIITIFYAFKKSKDLKKSRETLLIQYKYDRLTSLENRESLIIEASKQDDTYVVLINIIDFKTINNMLGFTEADKILIKISKELSLIIYEVLNIKLYRLYGNEFGFICDVNTKIKNICNIIKNRFENINIPHLDNELTFNINMAYSNICPKLLNATLAIETSKKSLHQEILEGNKDSQNSNYGKTLKMLKILKEAISDDRIIPIFQGIMDNQTEKISKYETLVRIQTKEGELISPSLFIDLSKKFKMYPYITKIVLTKAFEYFKNKSMSFSVNFSYIDIHNKDILNFFYNLLEENKQTAKYLTIEILETENIDSYDELIAFKHYINEYGCQLAIDDFGAGYSNLVAILRLKPNFIKIDGSLIQNLHDKNSMSLVKTIVTFARENDIKTVAEFVSSKELYILVRNLGIDFSQGYYFSKPKILK